MLNSWTLIFYPVWRLKGLGIIKIIFILDFRKKILGKPVCVSVRELSMERTENRTPMNLKGI